MKTATFPAVLRSALAAVALAVLPGNLMATTVAWVSGGPNAGHLSGAGYVDGNITSQAEYHTPCGLAMDLTGNWLYVADYNNNAIRVLDFTVNTTGTFLTYSNNTVVKKLFSKPVGVAIDDQYNVFVLNHGAKKGEGSVMEFNYLNQIIATNMTHITNAAGIALDPFDNIYLTASNRVFRISNVGAISLLTTITSKGADLQGIVVKPNGILAVCDAGRDGILLINPTNDLVTTNAGFHGRGDFISLTDTASSNVATFFQPSGIAASGDGTLIVSDYGNERVKAVLPNGSVTNIYGVKSKYWAGNYPGFMDGKVSLPDTKGGVAARHPKGVVVAPDGSLYVSEDYYHIIRHVTDAGFQPPPSPPPTAPTGLTATVVTNGANIQVYLQWNSIVSGTVTNYLVERATSSGGPYAIIDQTLALNFTDPNVVPGETYYYVIVAENAGGESGDSGEASVTIPVPPPSAPIIGWFDYEGSVVDGFFSTIHSVPAGNPFTVNNPIPIAIAGTTNAGPSGYTTVYVTSPPLTNSVPASVIATNYTTAPPYENDELQGTAPASALPPLPLLNGEVTIEAINTNSGGYSAVTSATFEYQIGGPAIVPYSGNELNSAQFIVQSTSTNVTFYYTLDGTDPTNAPPSQQVFTTDGQAVLSLNGSTNIFFRVRGIGNGAEANYLMSGITPFDFTPGTSVFLPNTISWGFASGEGSSAFVGAAGETFYAPITLTMLPNTPIYSLQFNMTITNNGPGITNAGVPTVQGAFGFQSMLMQPVPPPSNAPTVLFYEPIPPLMFADYATNLVGSQLVTNSANVVFVSLEVTNEAENLLAVGWLERYGFTNLYDTLSQDLIKYSQAHDDVFPDADLGEPLGTIVGGYSFQIPVTAQNGQQYQIQIGSPSATDNGIGNPGSAVDIFGNTSTNSANLAPGTLNAIKNVTVSSTPYLVGDVYNFRWFNAGDFGTGNLSTKGSANAEQVFEAAAYQINEPPPGSDFFDAMDSCGAMGILDTNPADEFFGYYTNVTTNMTATEEGQLFAGDANSYSTMDQIAFGDGNLDICDVYVTYVRSLDPSRVWFDRLWTNGVRVATTTPDLGTAVVQSGASLALVSGGGQVIPNPSSASITNTPIVNFTAGDAQTNAGDTVSIPVNASVFGPYPLLMLMMNVSVVPLDGSPALTAAISFNPNPALATAFGSSTAAYSDSSGNGNYSAAWLPNSSTLPSSLPGLTGTANIGTLNVTLPANATSSSAYAIHFDRASASPSGLISFPKTTYTGLITLSSRTNSSYNDGIPDSWRLRYFGTIYNQLSVSNADADGTGMNNWQKYLAGLNPVSATSVFNEGMDQSVAQGPQDAVIYWPSVTGKTYIIKRSSGLFPPQWTSISTNTGDGSYMEIHDASGGNNRFYEVTTP